MTDSTAVAAVQKTITGGRMNPTAGTLTEIPGTDAVSQRVSVLQCTGQIRLFSYSLVDVST